MPPTPFFPWATNPLSAPPSPVPEPILYLFSLCPYVSPIIRPRRKKWLSNHSMPRQGTPLRVLEGLWRQGVSGGWTVLSLPERRFISPDISSACTTLEVISFGRLNPHQPCVLSRLSENLRHLIQVIMYTRGKCNFFGLTEHFYRY